MNRIQQAFKDKKAFIPSMTTGDPDPSVTETPVSAMAEADADLVGLGIPFSDLVAEGIVIQEADLRSLVSGTTTNKISDTVRRIRQKTDVSLASMTYINPVFAYGVNKFMKNAANRRIDALIVPDIPFKEKEELLPACKKYDTTLIYLVAPASRGWAQAITRESGGFICRISSLGVTGVQGEITMNIKEMVDIVRQGRSVLCAIGFGISTPEQVSKMALQVDGIIVGGAIVKMIARYGINCVEPVYDYIKQMKTATGVQTVWIG